MTAAMLQPTVTRLRQRRFKIRFPEDQAFEAATALETETLAVPVLNPKRRYLAVTVPEPQVGMVDAEVELDHQLQVLAAMGGEIVEDYQYDLDDPPPAPTTDSLGNPGLDDVLAQIRATEVWHENRGEGALIAVVDTGIDGTRPEFPIAKRKGSWQPLGDASWTDWKGHGTMCACIAAGTKIAGGAFDGVAPGAGLVACKTYLFDTELGAIYDYLIGLVDADPNLRIVATNSFGRKTGSPPVPPVQSDFVDALEDAIARGIAVFFSAGNNHELAGGHPVACDPNSIWLHKSRADLVSVATCELTGPMWHYSSRGPGQHFGDSNTNRKPDVTAPTPRNGKVVYGASIRTFPTGWGTSGACPQAAGLAALLWSKTPALTPADLYAAIRRGAVDLGHGPDCQGHGRIDCAASLALV